MISCWFSCGLRIEKTHQAEGHGHEPRKVCDLPLLLSKAIYYVYANTTLSSLAKRCGDFGVRRFRRKMLRQHLLFDVSKGSWKKTGTFSRKTRRTNELTMQKASQIRAKKSENQSKPHKTMVQLNPTKPTKPSSSLRGPMLLAMRSLLAPFARREELLAKCEAHCPSAGESAGRQGMGAAGGVVQLGSDQVIDGF